MQLVWADIVQQIADRIREPEDTGTIPTGEVDIPYYTDAIIEDSLLEISQQLLREVPEDDLQDIGSPAIDESIYVSESPLPLELIKILSVSIQISITDPKFYPTQPLATGLWVQSGQVPSSDALTWSVLEGDIVFTGFQAKVLSIIEPALSVWQGATVPILPDGYDDMRIDWCVKQLRQMNNMPTGTI